MTEHQPRTPIECCTEMTELVGRALQLLRLQRQFHAAVDAELRPYCQLVRIDDDTAVIRATSSPWATRLRFMTPQLTALVRTSLGIEVRAVRIVVRPELPDELRPGSQARPISAGTRDNLERAAASFGDSELADVLRRIASRHSSR